MPTFPDGPSRRGRSSSAGTHTPLTQPVIPPARCPLRLLTLPGYSAPACARQASAHVLAQPSGCPQLAVLCLTKRQGLIHHAAIVRLPNTNCGITTYPNRVIGTAGPSPAGMQSCRLLKTPNDPLLSLAHYQSRGGQRSYLGDRFPTRLHRYNP